MMADLRDCIDSAVSDGHMSEEAALEYLDRIEAIAEGLTVDNRLSFHEAQVRAALRLEGEIERQIRRRKRSRLLMAARQAELESRVVGAEDRRAAPKQPPSPQQQIHPTRIVSQLPGNASNDQTQRRMPKTRPRRTRQNHQRTQEHLSPALDPMGQQ